MSSQPPRQYARSAAFVIAALLFWSLAKGAHGRAQMERNTWPKIEEYRQFLAPKLAPLIGRELAADLLWMQVLVYYGNYDSDYHYLPTFLNAIYRLAPRFRQAWQWGAAAVTFQKEHSTPKEYRLAIDILERAIEHFPDDFDLHYTLGIRYFFDTPGNSPEERRKQKERGAELLEKAMRLPGANQSSAQLAASLRTKLGQSKRALAELRQMILTTDNESKRAQLLRRYQEISQDPELARSLVTMYERFIKEWQQEMPYVPLDFSILVGKKPSAAVNIENVVPVRSLFGLNEDEDEDESSNPSPPTSSRTTRQKYSLPEAPPLRRAR